ncbi:MAG: GIY-YIG nuclease family protein [Gammaproteobacteria bacterium]|nr:GIY-YIG nuclease family protein [Gammaproteobacteria bacterium]
MFYVYLLESESVAGQRYIGYTRDLRARLRAHNAGLAGHSAKFVPWRLVFYSAFSSEQKAHDFERYLKTGSGQAFASKRFW